MTTAATTTTLYTTLHYTNLETTPRYTTPQLQLHYTTLHPALVGDVATATNSNYFSLNLWIRSAIHTSQHRTSPIVSYL